MHSENHFVSVINLIHMLLQCLKSGLMEAEMIIKNYEHTSLNRLVVRQMTETYKVYFLKVMMALLQRPIL